MPSVRLKPLPQQVVLITGASSGIGLATARAFAARGAAVVLVARDEASLAEAVEGIRAHGGRAAFHAADVADRAALEAAADLAEREFGGLDTWVNDAGATIYGKLENVSLEDQRRLFETNYWGTVHGSLIAARRLKAGGGAIINVGSALSDRAVPWQGAYCATKHAVRAFTEALRMELEVDGAPVSVTLIKPAGIDTTLQEHARIRMDTPGVRVPPVVYDPRLVARAILFAAQTPRRDLYVGGSGAMIGLMGNLFPRATDLVMEAIGRPLQTTDNPGRPEMRDNLYEGRPGGDTHSVLRGMPQRRTSLFLEMQMRPVATLAAVAGLGALALGAVAARRAGHGRVASRLPRAAAGLMAVLPAARAVAGTARDLAAGTARSLADGAARDLRGTAREVAGTAREVAGVVERRGGDLLAEARRLGRDLAREGRRRRWL